MAANEKKPRVRAAAKPKAEAGPKKTVTRARKPKAAPVAASEFRFEHVAERAYFLWQNGAGGDSTAHWLQAERELAAA
jgi:hypothetical protein